MRTLLLAGWLLVPLGVGIWHYGPGQERVQLDQVSVFLAGADRHAAAGEWALAVEMYDRALEHLPETQAAAGRRIRLERAKAQMQASQLPAAHTELKTLCDELQADPGDGKLLAEVRSARAQAEYYMTWLMRLEGLPQDVWEPEIESARQNYRLLAEQADRQGDVAAGEQSRKDLEAAVRLARMDLSELQGLSLPCQCKGCCSGKGRCLGTGKGKSPKKQGDKDARGASSGPPPDDGGH
jgi:hypothetical protein